MDIYFPQIYGTSVKLNQNRQYFELKYSNTNCFEKTKYI